ncbi:MAG: T9SS C-terminal target domain-containing protein [Calditrichaeota bacterium]|nr:MAG: T9SS C-terminal target domain-containing protein [Calditrichota bacterium]
MQKLIKTSLLIIFFSGFAFGKSHLPQTRKELSNNSENVLIEYQKQNTAETFFLLGLKENVKNHPTLYKSLKNDLSFLNWESLDFYEPVEALRVSERDSKIFFIFTPKGEIYSTTNNGYSFEKANSESVFSKSEFEKLTEEIEPSLQSQNLNFNFEKYTPPSITQTVWDTILWDTVQTLETNNVTSGAFAHGVVEAGDSGLVHVAVVKEDNLLRYFRSTDYGASFEPVVVLDDSIGGVLEVVATGDYLYIFGGYSITLVSNPVPYLLSSNDKGLTWNQIYDFPFIGTQWGFGARNDTAYHYFESGAGGSVWQSKSFDGGLTFSPYVAVVDTIYASLQYPKVAIGENTIIYARMGNDLNTSNAYANVSSDLGDSWNQHISFAPAPISNSQSPNISYSDSIFHTVQRIGGVFYRRTEDFGNSFSPYQGICLSADFCSATIGTQISSHGSNIFPLWHQENLIPQGEAEMVRTRFSRNNGVDWSPIINASDSLYDYYVIGPEISISSNDSLIYVSYVRVTSFQVQDPNILIQYRRGFYKFPLFDSIKKLELGIVDSSTTTDTTFVIQNKGVVPLVISQIDFPSEISTGLLALPFTIQPDSTFNFQVFFTPQSSGLYSDTLKFHTNQQIGSLKKIAINAEIFVDLEEKENLPDKISLSQNFPNPFNPSTTINYEFGTTNYEIGKLVIFNVLGEKVKEFELLKNKSSVVWDGTNSLGKQVSSGIYFYRLKTDGFEQTKKMLLLR